MLSVSIKLDHIVVTLIDGISSGSLKTNCQTTINWHGNNVTVQRTTYFACTIARPIINNHEVKFRCDSSKLSNGIFNTLFFIICRNCNKSFCMIGQTPTNLSLVEKEKKTTYHFIISQNAQLTKLMRPANVRTMNKCRKATCFSAYLELFLLSSAHHYLTLNGDQDE